MKNHIEKWLKEGLIDERQSKQMLADIEKKSSEKASKKIIFTFSIIGSALVGIGAILFVAANWQQIPHLVKIFSLMALTCAAAYGGYYLEYENKNYPKTGSSLLFLSAMLFGALIFLTAQIYHVESSGRLHLLVLIWLLSVLPYVYLFKSKAVALLSCALLFTWISILTFDARYYGSFSSLPLLFCGAALFVFAFGKLHDFFTGYEELSPVFEKFSTLVIFLCLFLMTFRYFAMPADYGSRLLTDWLLSASALILLTSFIFNPAKRKNNTFETVFILCILLYCVLMNGGALARLFYVPEHDSYYYGGAAPLLACTNVFFALSVLGLIMTGYLRKKMFYVNLGIFWLIVFLTFKYFDFFWNLMPRSLFFLAGGVVLVGSALLFEHKRRAIKSEFKLSE